MFRSFITLCVFGLTSVGAQASLVGRAALTPGGTDYQSYYDTVLDITWVADANLAQTSGYDAIGRMNWTAAVGWIASLNAQNGGLGYLGVNNWRLPTVTDTGVPGCDFPTYSGGTDCGYNVDLATGEMARMYYSTLGNTAAVNISGVLQPCAAAGPNYCLTNTGPFSNLQPSGYWSGTENAPYTTHAWEFWFNWGYQDRTSKSNQFRAWAVTDGDALAAVPVPGAIYLFGSALGLMGVMRRKISS